jgi:hypothetical protein
VFGQKRDRAELLDDTIVILSQEQLRNVRTFKHTLVPLFKTCM